MQFNVETAKQYANESRLQDWLNTFLTSENGANEGLAQAVRERQGLWVGPLEIEINKLRRSSGPESQSTHPHIVWPIPTQKWESDVSKLEQNITDSLLLPPLIIRCEQGIFGIQDGNRRYEAMKRKGWSKCWVLVEYDNEEDKKQYNEG